MSEVQWKIAQEFDEIVLVSNDIMWPVLFFAGHLRR